MMYICYRGVIHHVIFILDIGYLRRRHYRFLFDETGTQNPPDQQTAGRDLTICLGSHYLKITRKLDWFECSNFDT